MFMESCHKQTYSSKTLLLPAHMNKHPSISHHNSHHNKNTLHMYLTVATPTPRQLPPNDLIHDIPPHGHAEH